MEITEKWLGDIAGWQVLRDARKIHQAGAVSNATFTDNLLRGQVLEGGKELSSGLRILTQTNVENLCPCMDSRSRGLICRHSVAVGLSFLKPGTRASSPAPASPGAQPNKPAARKEIAPMQPIKLQGALSIIIAPDFYAKWQKNTLVVQFLTEGRTPDAADTPVLQVLQALGQSSVPPVANLDRSQAAWLLAGLAGHPRVFFRKSGNNLPLPMEIQREYSRLPLHLRHEGETVRFEWRHETETVLLLAAEAQPPRAWVCEMRHPATDALRMPVPPTSHSARLIPLPLLSPATATLLDEMASSDGRAARSPGWFLEQRDILQQVFRLEAEDDFSQRLRILPAQPEFELRLEGSLRSLEADLRCRYPVAAFVPEAVLDEATARRFPYPDPAAPGVYYSRHPAAELAAGRMLQTFGFRLLVPGSGRYRLDGEREIMAFYASQLPRLGPHWHVELGDRFRHVTAGIERLRPMVAPPGGRGGAGFSRQGADWLHLQVSYATDSGLRLPRDEVQRLLRSGRTWTKLPNGKTVVLDADAVEDFEEVLRDCQVEQVTTGGIRVRGAQRAYLLDATSAYLGDGSAAAPESSLPLPAAEDLRVALGGLAALLRPYQFEGVRWLEARARAGFGGLLADEMGLGKTLQSLALLLALRRGSPASAGAFSSPALVVCPTSLIGNWEAEARRFVPELPVFIHHGTDRHQKRSDMAGAGLVLTSYALLARDAETLVQQPFSLLLFDEASFLRNPDTLQAKAARAIKAGAKFALTGTPVENSVRDLWSVMQCVLPGYLGSKDDFKTRYETPLASGGGAREVLARLRRRLSPWLLRRTKAEVVKELPARLEQVQWCELSPFQQELYRRVLDQAQENIRDARRKKNPGAARMSMFTALLRLRQICNDVRLTGLEESVWHKRDESDLSGKWEALDEWLRELIEGGHRCLIFSQFVGMLHLVRARLEKAGIQFCYLDGSTTNRQEQVNTFQNDPGKTVFLISLKAGGYGLNLTAADHVLLLDPWWNPAVEAQAIDRAHRIGQERVVTGVRFITRGTVEEKILALQRRKRDVMEAAVDEIEPGLAGLGDEELEELLAT